MRAPFALLLLIFLTPLSASAWSGPIQSPELNYSRSLDAERQKKAAKILKFMIDDLKFVSGRFFGPHSSRQSFGGTSAQTAQMIRLLKDADIWNLTVQFADLKKQGVAFDLTVNYSGSLGIIVNSERDDFRLKDFAAFLKPQLFPATGDGKSTEVTLEEIQKSATGKKPSTPSKKEPKPALPAAGKKAK